MRLPPRACCLVLVTLLGLPAAFPAEHTISPAGRESGDGSAARPWDLQTALDHPAAVKPGDTLWLRGGTYGKGGATSFRCRLSGTQTAPIVVRQYPGERATVDGQIDARGAHTWFFGFEITNSHTLRKTDEKGRPTGLLLHGTSNKAINLVIHDVGQVGISPKSKVNVEVYGCIFWGNGVYDGSRIRGEGIYANDAEQDPAVPRYIQDCIAFRNFNYGIKVYSEWSSRYVNGYHLEGNVCFDHPKYEILVRSSENPIKRLTLLNNTTYRRSSATWAGNLCGDDIRNEDGVIQGNVFYGGATSTGALHLGTWNGLLMSGNTFISDKTFVKCERGSRSVVWDDNTYGRGALKPFKIGSSSYDFALWKSATGFDAKSTIRKPAGVRVFVRPNRYEEGRAHVIVYNPDQAPSVAVDLSGASLARGARYEVKDAQNYFGAPVLSGVYDGAPVMLGMTRESVSRLTGSVPHLDNTHTPREFGVFVVRPVGL